jgi:PAS domain S-box-containing protein
MKIRHKLILSFLLVALLASVTTLFALRSYSSISGTFDELVNDPTSMVAALNDLKHSGLQIVSSTNEFALIKNEGGWNSEEAMEEEEEELRERGIGSYREALQRYETLVKTVATDEGTTFHNISAAGENLIETSAEIIRLKKLNQRGNEVLDLRITFERDEDVYLKFVNEALQRESEEEAKGQDEVQATIQWATRGTVIVTILTFLLALFAGFYISHLISARVIRLQNAVGLVGAGELETQIEIGAEDELGELARSFNGMVGDLKAADATLRESEERHRKLFENNPFPMWVYDCETYRFLAVNDSAIDRYGYSRDEFLSMTLKDIRPVGDFELLLDHMVNVYSRENPTSTWRHRKKDGTVFDVEITAYSFEFYGRPA